MAIKYNVIKRGQPGIVGGGTPKWYAIAVTDGELTIDDLSKQIEKFSALSEPDIKGVLIALENLVVDNISKGKIIRLDKIGSFYPSLSSSGTIDEEDFNQGYIKGARVNYRPGRRITDALKTAKFQKVR